MKINNVDIGQPKYDYKTEYKVSNNFRWGELDLSYGESIFITVYVDNQNREYAVVTKKYQEQDQQIVDPRTVQNMVALQNLSLVQYLPL